MQRITILIQKLNELSAQGKNLTAIDVDLMLDYTRVMYADLLELRKTMPTVIDVQPADDIAPVAEPVPGTAPLEQPVTETITLTSKADVPVFDIRTRIGINDKYLFLSELFGDDRSAYETVIIELNKFTTADDALKWIDREWQAKYNWDKENETVQSFYDLVSSSFSSI